MLTPLSDDVELVCWPPNRISEIWPTVEPMLRAATERTGLSAFEDVASELLYGDALLWLAWSGRIEAAASTVLQITDAGKVCVITACSGTDMNRWLPLLARIEEYAKAEGAARTRIFGRPGWRRILSDYKQTNIVLDKELH